MSPRRGNEDWLTWRECLGRNAWEHPLEVPDFMGTEALNVSLRKGELGRKRLGSTDVTLTGDSFTGGNHLSKFIPGQDESAAELMIVSADATPKIIRLANGSTAAALTLKDNFTGNAWDVSTATLNKKHFFAYKSGVNRLHVFSPNESATLVRRVELATPAAPTVADTGAGAYPAVKRWYSVAYRVKSGSSVLRQSELSPAAEFTPNATSLAARITKPATIGEGETHWVAYAAAASADGPFYEIAEVAIATTTYDDTNIVDTYDDGDFPVGPLIGGQYPFPSVKFLASDGVRLFGLGVYETAAGDSVPPVAGRLYFTPAINTTGRDDNDERVQSTLSQDDWLDLNIGGVDRGIAGPVNGRMYCFQSDHIFMIVPTQDPTKPVKKIDISGGKDGEGQGGVSHHSLVIAEDESGAPALYYLNPKDGPRRIGLGADIQWLGKDVKDVWDTINLAASTRVAWGLYNQDTKQVIWWIATGSSNEPDTCIVHHTTLGKTESFQDVRGGWAKWNGPLAAMRHGVMFPQTLATTRPIRNVPYFANASVKLARQDGASNLDRGGTNFQGYVQSKAFDIEPIFEKKRFGVAALLAPVQAGSAITHTFIADWGARSPAVTVSLVGPSGGLGARFKANIDIDVADAITGQVRLGDASAVPVTWRLDRYVCKVSLQAGAR